MNRSIRLRVGLRFLLVQFALSAAWLLALSFGTAFDGADAEVAAHLLDERVSRIVSLDPEGRPSAPSDALARIAADDPGFWLIASGPAGDLVYRASAPAINRVRALSGAILSNAPVLAAAAPGHGPFILRKGVDGLTVAVAGSRAGRAQKLRFLFEVLAANVFIVAAVPFVGAAFVILLLPRDIDRALRSLSSSAATIERDPQARLDEGLAPREALPLVSAFNGLLDRLAEASTRQRRFLADVAHELRTPLSIARLRIDEMPAGDLRGRLALDIDRLTGRIEALLAMARLREGLDTRAPVDLAAVARDLVRDRAPRAAEAGCELALEAPPAMTVLAHAGLAETALANLVDNAITHAGPGTCIVVRLPSPGIVEIVDDGRGIPADLRAAATEPFVRGGAGGQLGIGLALVSEAVAMMGGALILTETPQGGTTARISFSGTSLPTG